MSQTAGHPWPNPFTQPHFRRKLPAPALDQIESSAVLQWRSSSLSPPGPVIQSLVSTKRFGPPKKQVAFLVSISKGTRAQRSLGETGTRAQKHSILSFPEVTTRLISCLVRCGLQTCSVSRLDVYASILDMCLQKGSRVTSLVFPLNEAKEGTREAFGWGATGSDTWVCQNEGAGHSLCFPVGFPLSQGEKGTPKNQQHIHTLNNNKHAFTFKNTTHTHTHIPIRVLCLSHAHLSHTDRVPRARQKGS